MAPAKAPRRKKNQKNFSPFAHRLRRAPGSLRTEVLFGSSFSAPRAPSGEKFFWFFFRRGAFAGAVKKRTASFRLPDFLLTAAA
jgi:hypothetical protein